MGTVCGICTSKASNQVIESYNLHEPSKQPDPGAKDKNTQSRTRFMTKGKGRRKQKHNAVRDYMAYETDYQEAVTAQITEKPMEEWEQAIVFKVLSQHFVFDSLGEDDLIVIMHKMKHYCIGSDQIVVEQGTPAINFFVIIKGELQVIINGEAKSKLSTGISFGELALLHDTERTATIETVQDSELWGLDRQTFRETLVSINAQNYLENKNFIENIPVFQLLTDEQREALIGSLIQHKYCDGENIVIEGDPGDLLFIIKEGSVQCIQRNKVLRIMSKGEFFGEQALMYNTERTATIRAIDSVKCLSIKRENLTSVLGSHLQQIIYRNSIKIALENTSIGQSLDYQQMEHLVESMIVETFNKGEIVIPSGQIKGAKLYIVLKGKLQSSISHKIKGNFTCVNHRYITSDIMKSHTEDYFAIKKTHLAFIDKEQFIKAIGGQLQALNKLNEFYNSIRRIKFLSTIENDRLQQIAANIREVVFQDGEAIITQEEKSKQFYIIKRGKVDVIKDGKIIRTVTRDDYFGERAILLGGRRTASVIAQDQVECWMIEEEDILKLLTKANQLDLLNRIDNQDCNYSLDELMPIKKLGQGMFGECLLVIAKKNKKLFALKSVHRSKIQLNQIYQNLVLERQILLQLDHPMIMKLFRTFKDENRVYFLTEFIDGVDLFDALRDMNLLDETKAKLYSACLILIISYLHERNIVYRDLKPENVMIEASGYPKLIDLGTAKILNGRTFTIVGTPHYMAPEILTGIGYNQMVDYWSIGIMLYEFIYGEVPFGEEIEDTYQIYSAIAAHDLKFPSKAYNLQSTYLIQQLLSANPATRTGGGVEKLKLHPLFNGLNWSLLRSKQIPMPYKPNVQSIPSIMKQVEKSTVTVNQLLQEEEAKDEVFLPRWNPSRDAGMDWDKDF